MSYRKILLAIDVGANSDPIGRRGVAMANAFNAQIHLLHVVEYVPIDPAGEALMPPPVELEAELIAASHKRLEEFAFRTGLKNAPRDVRIGNIKMGIVNAAAELHADLIIIGRHQRHGFALFRGSTERSLAAAARCDILAVRVNN